MNGAGDELFAGSAFTADEHGGVVGATRSIKLVTRRIAGDSPIRSPPAPGGGSAVCARRARARAFW